MIFDCLTASQLTKELAALTWPTAETLLIIYMKGNKRFSQKGNFSHLLRENALSLTPA